MGGGDWGYEEHNGPSQWASKYRDAGGQKQSPINIIPSETQLDQVLEQMPLEWSYEAGSCKKVLNTGYGWRVEVEGKHNILQGGPLQHRYRLCQFHCHWGRTEGCGSEHTVDGKPFDGELHLVHWNTDLYPSAARAACSEDGLAVLGVFFQVGNAHPEIQKVVDVLHNIKHRGEEFNLQEDLDIGALLPANHSYWTYEGSLTTPPCNESVSWLLFKNPVEVSATQLASFRQMCCEGKGEEKLTKLEQNFRPPQPLCNRVVREMD